MTLNSHVLTWLRRSPMNGAPIPMNGAATPWPRGCVSHCESVCSSTAGCVGFTMHSDKPPNMASCELKNCTTDFELVNGFELYQVCASRATRHPHVALLAEHAMILFLCVSCFLFSFGVSLHSRTTMLKSSILA